MFFCGLQPKEEVNETAAFLAVKGHDIEFQENIKKLILV